MASIHDESPPNKKRKKPIRKFKGPNDAIKRTAVVLREGVVFKKEETDEVFMPTTIAMSNDIKRRMASIHDESPPNKKRKKPIRKFKGPNDAIKRTAVVLREGVVFKKEETDEVFMPTTITMSNDINRDPELRKEISFTKSMKPDEVKELLKTTFPVLSNTERFYCAKAVQKEKLDFCGERCIWSGEVLNREIKGHSVLYIYYEEVNSGQYTSSIAPVENMQISRNESSSEDCRDSGFETCNTSQGSSRNQTNPLLSGSITRSPEPWHEFRANPDIEESLSEDCSDPGYKTGNTQDSSRNQGDPLLSTSIISSPQLLDEYRSNCNVQLRYPFNEVEKTFNDYSETDDSIGDVFKAASTINSDSEGEGTMQDTLSRNSPNNAVVEQTNQDVAQENSHSNVEAEEANRNNAEQGNSVQKICPSVGPVEGGGTFQISVREELPDHVQSGYALFGDNRVVVTRLNKFTLEGIIPAAQQPGVVKVHVFSCTNSFLGEADFDYEDMMNKVVYQAVQLGSEGVSKLFKYMEKHCRDMWIHSSSVKQNAGQATGAVNDSCQERSSLAENTVTGDEYEDLGQHLLDIVKWLSEESFNPAHSNTDVWLKISNAVWGLCIKLACSANKENFNGDQQACLPESEESYLADAENSSCISSENDSISLSDLEEWIEPPNDSSLLVPLVYTRSSECQEANPNAESTQHSHKAAKGELDVSSEIPAAKTEGFISECSMSYNKYVGSGDCPEWNRPLPEPKETEESYEKDVHDEKQGSSQECALYSEESTSHTLLASQDNSPVLCVDVPALNVENEETQYQDGELIETLHTENAKPQPLESILSVTSNQQSTTLAGPVTQEAAQSPISNPLWNGTGDSKLNMASPQSSDEEIHSGHEWEESGLASWFDLCENEDVGMNEPSRWEMSSMDPNNTEGCVEKDVFDSEKDLSQEQGFFSEEGNLNIHLSSPDDSSVQSLGPEVENNESQWDIETKPCEPSIARGFHGFSSLVEEEQMQVSDLFSTDSKQSGAHITLPPVCSNASDIPKMIPVTLPLALQQNLPTGDLAEQKNCSTFLSRLESLKISAEDKEFQNSHEQAYTETFPVKGSLSGQPLRQPRCLKTQVSAKEASVSAVTEDNQQHTPVTVGASDDQLIGDISLIEAAEKGYSNRVSLLIEKGADVNQRGRVDTPLTAAAKNGHIDIVRLLIENKADVNKEEWDTPLTAAAKKGHTDISRLLIENGADVNKLGGELEDTPLAHAARNGCTDTVRLLIENEADLNKAGRDIPLTAAAKSGHTDVVRVLTENGADVNKEKWGDTPLTAAVKNGHTDIVRLLLENSADVNKGVQEDTLLTTAVENGYTDIVRLLLQNGADVNKGVRDTPLTAAVKNGDTDIVGLLLENGADVYKGVGEVTPLTAAVKNRYTDILRLLLKKGADVDKRVRVDTLLIAAVKNGHTDVVSLLLENGADLQGVREDSPLTAAVRNGHTEIVRLLLKNGADVNRGVWKDTPLTAAVKNRYTDILRLLLENGADVNKGVWGDSPLTAAVKNGHTEIVWLILKNRPDVNKGVWEDTPLTVALKNGHTDVVRLLLEKGADVNKGVWEDTLLTAAVKNGHTDIVRLLLKNGADVNKGIWEDSPLSVAVKNCHTDCLRLLLENGADVNKGVWEDSPLSAAVKNGHTDCVRLLLENGADVNKGVWDALGTAAVKNGYTEIVSLFIANGGDVSKGVWDTILFAAVTNGHTDIAKLLIDNGADVNEARWEGTPLTEAVKNGHTDLVRLLIENGGDVNDGGFFGSTPLTEAARIGHNDIVGLLIEKGADLSKEGGLAVIQSKLTEKGLRSRKFEADARSTELSLERCVDVVDVQLREKKKTSPANSRKYKNEPREISFDKNREDEAEENDDVDTELSLVSSYPCYGQY